MINITIAFNINMQLKDPKEAFFSILLFLQ